MAKLSQREVDAVVTTVIKKIREANANSPEQLAYKAKLDAHDALNKEIREKSKQVVEDLVTQYQQKYPELEFSRDNYYNRAEVEKPDSPSNYVNENDIERELIIANISGNIQETMDNLVTKYTNKYK